MARASLTPMSELANYPPMLLDERRLALGAHGWIWEIKFDGYRVIAKFGAGECELRTKGGADATNWFPEVARSLAAVPGGPFIADGEVCVLDELGRSDFNALQDRASHLRWPEGAPEVTYCVFDLLAEGDEDLCGLRVLDRKQRLASVLGSKRPNILYVGHFSEQVAALFRHVATLKLEGLVAKRADSIYRPGIRSTDWVKVKRKGAIPAERLTR